jgi:hypothetical protein
LPGRPASGRHKGTIGEVANYICAILLRGGKMPIGRYIAFVGSLLVAMLFIANWLLPMDPILSATSEQADKPIIRIKSDRKWPERIVFDTNAPTIVPQKSPVIADAPVTNPPREAFALLNAPVQEVSVTPLPVKSKRKIANAPHPPGGRHIDRLQEQKRYPLVGSSMLGSANCA